MIYTSFCRTSGKLYSDRRRRDRSDSVAILFVVVVVIMRIWYACTTRDRNDFGPRGIDRRGRRLYYLVVRPISRPEFRLRMRFAESPVFWRVPCQTDGPTTDIFVRFDCDRQQRIPRNVRRIYYTPFSNRPKTIWKTAVDEIIVKIF